MYTLTNSTALVTGASAGIGAACAETLARSGARVVLGARRMDRLEAQAAHLHDAFNATVYPLQLDVRDASQVHAALDALPAAWQEIDILVNNAGVGVGLDKAFETTPAAIDTMVDTNVKGLLYVTEAVVPGMVTRNRGHIINIGSIAGRNVYPGNTVYCATKHAVVAITKGLRIDLHGTPVRVSTVDPGLVETEFSISRFDGDTGRADAVYAGLTPLTPADIADAVLYCATRPPHVNIDEIVMMCVDQSAPTMVRRDG